MSKQLQMNEAFTEVTEADLKPQEVQIEDLIKEELVRLCNDKDIELGNYRTVVDQITAENKNIREMYNSDMNYISTINSNLIKVSRRKEDAINSIIKGAMVLMTLDREEIAPERKENN